MTEAGRRPTKPWLLPALMMAGGLGGLALGAALGRVWSDPSLEPFVLGVRLLGTAFLGLLKAIAVPVIATSVILALQAFDDRRSPSRLAFLTASYYLATTVVAVCTGLALVVLLHPGRTEGAPPPLPAGPVADGSVFRQMYDVVSGMFPPNLFGAAAGDNVLGLLVFSLIFGGALARMGPRARPLVQAIEVVNEGLFVVIRWVMYLAPLGVFGLVADRIGVAGGGSVAWDEVRRLGMYATTVMTGLAVHAFLTLPLLLRLAGKLQPWRYLAGMTEALVTAWGTASSAAALGVTLRCVVERNRISPRTAEFVVPLGATVNMDGTALYEAVAVVFVAQSLGVELGPVQLTVVAATATLAAIGAAAIPEAGLVTMVVVLSAVGLPAESAGVILAIDWILDRFRTAVNVWGDAVGAGIVDRQMRAVPEAT